MDPKWHSHISTHLRDNRRNNQATRWGITSGLIVTSVWIVNSSGNGPLSSKTSSCTQTRSLCENSIYHSHLIHIICLEWMDLLASSWPFTTILLITRSSASKRSGVLDGTSGRLVTLSDESTCRPKISCEVHRMDQMRRPVAPVCGP